MNSTHCSKGAVLGIVLVVSLLVAAPAAAVTLQGEPPEASQVGEQVSMTITIEEPFADAPDQWTLRGDTELEDASWTVTTIEQGRTLETNDYNGNSFEQDLNIDSGVTEIEITVDGTVPELTEFNYDDREVEEFTVASVGRGSGDQVNVLQSWQVHRFTEESREARQAIADAEEVVSESSSEEAQNLLEDAKAFYNNEEWERAIENAEQARSVAEESQSGLPLIPIVAGAVVLIALVAGGLYYRKQQQKGYKLQ